MTLRRCLLWLFCGLVLAFILAPIAVVVGTSFSDSPIYEFPPRSLSWRWYRNLSEVPGLLDSFVFSIQIAGVTTLISVALGATAAFALFRGNVPGREPLTVFLLSPIMLPGIVVGIALLQAYRLVGLTSSFWGCVIGHVIITMPYALRTVLASLHMFDFTLLDAASTLGARPALAIRRVLLPQIMPGVVAGALFAFVTSFDNYAVTMFLVDARSLTLPIRIINYTETSPDPTVSAIATIVFLLSVLVLFLGDRLVGLKRLSGIDSSLPQSGPAAG